MHAHRPARPNVPPPIPWSAARGALEGPPGSRRRSPKGHRRCAASPCQCHVSTPDERAHAGGDRGPRVNGGRGDGLLAIRSQAVTYLRSRLPSRTSASTFCAVDECGYGDNPEAASKTWSRIWTRTVLRPALLNGICLCRIVSRLAVLSDHSEPPPPSGVMTAERPCAPHSSAAPYALAHWPDRTRTHRERASTRHRSLMKRIRPPGFRLFLWFPRGLTRVKSALRRLVK